MPGGNIKSIKLIYLAVFLFVISIAAQRGEQFSPQKNYNTYPNVMMREGQQKTSVGTLRTLIIYVRYLDDTLNTQTWPDYKVLPQWAQTFVDPDIPSSKKFTPNNLSDFFDRASGGDGAGHPGKFHVIGKVVYITTKHRASYYKSDSKVFEEIFRALDKPDGGYNINFKELDNWQFMSGGALYNHRYKPGSGDGVVDQIWVINRGYSRDGVGAEMTLGGANYKTNDGVIISNTSGSRIFLGERNIETPEAVKGPAHEYCHYLFGGNQITGHFDGRSYNNFRNEGRVNMYALMCAVNSGYMSSYEEYRLGWLNPVIINSDTTVTLKDSHIDNCALIIPLRYDSSNGWLKEYYFIENYETKNEYSGANPFVQSYIFNHQIKHGILVYHIKNEDYSTATNSNISIVNADGKYTWKLLKGASTPYNREDDLIGKDTADNKTGFEYRDYITIRINDKVKYDDYACLIHHNIKDPDGWRYDSDDFLGTERDFFNTDFNNVFTRFSNPAVYMGKGKKPANIGFQILNFNSETKAFTLKIAVDYKGILTLAPSKPQDLRIKINSSNEAVLTWKANLEPNIKSYRIYKSKGTGNDSPEFTIEGTVSSNQTNWTDPDKADFSLSGNLFYAITAINKLNKESDKSDYHALIPKTK